MAWKNLKQRSLADDLMVDHAALEELDDVSSLIGWNRLESMLSHIHSKRQGEKAWPPIMMFKALLLQSWYGLSDPALEKQLARDLLFRRFVDLSLSESVPDHSTFWRFRNLLEKEGLFEVLLDEINAQLANQGLLIRTGEVSIIDASVIEAKQNRPKKDKNGDNTQDPEAAYNVKQGSDGKIKTTYGFKTHANVDEDGFIKTYDYTAGNVHDSNVFETLLTGNEKEVYADSAYKSSKHDALLKNKGTRNRVLERAYRNKPLTDIQKRTNRMNSGVRSIVERVFGVLKLHYGMSKARYLGLSRNKARFGLMSLAYNIKRGASIQRTLKLVAE
jgi:IS5 family transposase